MTGARQSFVRRFFLAFLFFPFLSFANYSIFGTDYIHTATFLQSVKYVTVGVFAGKVSHTSGACEEIRKIKTVTLSNVSKGFVLGIGKSLPKKASCFALVFIDSLGRGDGDFFDVKRNEKGEIVSSEPTRHEVNLTGSI